MSHTSNTFLRGRPSLRPAYPWLLLGGFCFALLWPLGAGQTLYWGDILLYFAPMYDYLTESLRQGIVPLWDPYVLCGQPLVGNPQMSVFYPATLALNWVDTWNYVGLTSLIHLWLAGALAYAYLRRWTTGNFAAVAGACVYTGNAFVLGKLQFPPMLQSAAWLPGLLWSTDRVLDTPGMRSSLLLATCTGMVLLAGHAQIAYIALLCVLCYATMRLYYAMKLRHGTDTPFFWRQMRFLTVALALGVSLSAVHVLPALQLTMTSSRLHLNPWDTNRFTLEPKHLLTLVFPSFLGHPASGDYWGGETPWEPALFAGWVPLLLAARAVYRRWHYPPVRFWACMAFLGIWLAFGVWGGLYLVAYYLLPGLANFHDPARFLLWTVWALSVLTALGLSGSHSGKPVRAGILAGIVVPLWFYGLFWNPFAPGKDLRAVVQSVVPDRVSTLPGGEPRVYYPAHRVYWNRHVTDGYSDYGHTDLSTLRLWVSTLLPNLPLFKREEIMPGYEPVPVVAVTELDAGARAMWKRNDPAFLHYMRVLRAGVVRLPFGSVGARPYATTVVRRPGEGTVSLKIAPIPPPVWVTRRAQYISGTKRTLAAMGDPGFDPEQVTLIDGVATEVSEHARAGVSKTCVELLEVTRHSFCARVDAGDAPAFLTLASTAYPGWWARVDAQVQRPLRVYGAFLGVPLPSGRHHVQMEYRPFVYRLGLYLSLTTLSVMTAIKVYSAARPRRLHIVAAHP